MQLSRHPYLSRVVVNMNAAGSLHEASRGGEDLTFVARMLGVVAGLGAVPATNPHRSGTAQKRSRSVSHSSNDAQLSHESSALLAQHNRPTNKSNSKQYFCEACNCSVAARERDWDIHTSGIKHKRQLVSLLHTGQFGSDVVSLFESEPGR